MENGQAQSQDGILRVEEVVRTVVAERGPRRIIDSFSYSFKQGSIYTLVGPSGSGKTSLLRLLNRLDEKDGGRIFFHGQAIEEYAVTDLRRKISLVFQIPYLFPGTIGSNLAYCCHEKHAGDTEFATHYLSLVGLEPDLADRDPETLSVGQKQRVALARALVQEPEILLLDEPTSSLDPGAARTIEELVVKLNHDLGLTIIMVTHNFRQAQRLKGTSVFLVNGRLIESGPSAELFTKPSHEITKRFVSGELR
jgi:putative ABC transport system ATP-binding protein